MVRESFVAAGTGRVRVLEAGAGWPVLLLHAFPLNADMWRPQLERVPDGWRYIAPDLGGFGPAAGESPAAASMDEMASSLVRLLDALEIERAAIGGLSMGGYVTLALLRLAPERFSAFILADSRSEADTAEGREGRRKMLDLVRTGGASAVAEQMLPKLLGETTRRERPDVATLARGLIEGNRPEAIAAAIEAMMERPDSTPLLARIGVPALLLVGSEDTLTPPADSEAMQRAIPRSRLVVIEGAGHLSNLEAPDIFSQALADFLTSNL